VEEERHRCLAADCDHFLHSVRGFLLFMRAHSMRARCLEFFCIYIKAIQSRNFMRVGDFESSRFWATLVFKFE